MRVLHYFANLSRGKLVLWCYLTWYLTTVALLFDPTPTIWLNSVGISSVIGVALRLSVTGGPGSGPDGWQTFRLFLMPFCVSSFATLIKGRGYFLVFPTRMELLVPSVGACAGMVVLHLVLRTWLHRR